MNERIKAQIEQYVDDYVERGILHAKAPALCSVCGAYWQCDCEPIYPMLKEMSRFVKAQDGKCERCPHFIGDHSIRGCGVSSCTCLTAYIRSMEIDTNPYSVFPPGVTPRPFVPDNVPATATASDLPAPPDDSATP